MWRTIRGVGCAHEVASEHHLIMCYWLEKNRHIVFSGEMQSSTLLNLADRDAEGRSIPTRRNGGRHMPIYEQNFSGGVGVVDHAFVKKLTRVPLQFKVTIVSVSCGRKHSC
ncbi:putative regulator of chromosome condensation (RCC1) [Trypanosoma grayi]|uniref:putative regulator of chromosome condensation (RCC1) n=1 Tax=Trypanosoma grayi TaxID=71804 RepID=UPI0004F421C1|nr:putative regulator of chromosome condensation (RCC1) [Trypanosoma grayi]KEG13004.1 putative regulator of chromosome condensation (RCC1) [Trypanosoma grayi]